MRMRTFSLAILLVVLLLCIAIPVNAAQITANGTCGDDLNWTLTANGTLTISGTGPMSSTWPQGLTPWNDYLDQITTLVVEEGVTSLGPKALRLCTNLTNVSLPSSCTTIHVQAFQSCTSLKEITLPEGVSKLAGRIFDKCTSLETVVLPSTIPEISASMFRDCSSLTQVNIPAAVSKVDNYAFAGCTGLTELRFPDTLTTMGSHVFDGCTQLTAVLLPDGVTKIGSQTFKNCSALQHITIPAELTAIAKETFYGCSSLTSVTIPGKVTSIADSAFSQCTNIVSVTLPESVTSITKYAFINCAGIQNVYYAGSEESWNAITFGVSNECLTGAALHFDFAGSLHAHTVSAEAALSPTCTSGGSIAHWKCSGCGRRFADEACETELLCKELLLPASGHTEAILPASKPTCTENGLTEGTACGVCGEVFTAQKVIPACGHEEVLLPAAAPGCVEDGLTEGSQCSLCKEILIPQQPIPAPGHSWRNDWKVLVAPAENAPGKAFVNCENCEIIRVEENPFLDLDLAAYYAGPVLWANREGITSGYEYSYTFVPDGQCTRAQIVTFLWRAAGMPVRESKENPFSDVPEDAWYTDAVLWAVEQGITNGYGSETTFCPNVICTRSQVATFLWRSADMPEPLSAEHPFTDIASDAFYYTAVLWAIEEGITNGYESETTFCPDRDCTRGQIVTFLSRWMSA